MTLKDIILLAIKSDAFEDVLYQLRDAFLDGVYESDVDELKKSYRKISDAIGDEAWRIHKLKENNMLGDER